MSQDIWIKESIVKRFFKDNKKQVSKDALEQFNEGFKKMVRNALRTTAHHKRTRAEEVIIGNKSFFQN